MKRLSLFLFSLCLFFSPLFHSCSSGMNKYTAYSFDVFDTVTTVIGYANSKTEFDRISETIFRELEEYHRLFTIYEKDDVFSNLHTINRLIDGEHPAVSVDARIIDMLLYAKEMYDLTEGKVNIAMGSVLSIWHTYREEGLQSPEHAKLPSPQDLKDAAEHCRIEDVMIDEKNGIVQLADPGMTLDVGAIAKGYAVEMIAGELEKNRKTQRRITSHIASLPGIHLLQAVLTNDIILWTVVSITISLTQTRKCPVMLLSLSLFFRKAQAMAMRSRLHFSA